MDNNQRPPPSSSSSPNPSSSTSSSSSPPPVSLPLINPNNRNKPVKKGQGQGKGPFNMDGTKLFLSLVAKIPLMARIILMHLVRASEQSKYLDLRTELIIAVIRSYMTSGTPRSVSHTQRMLGKAPSPKGRIWIARYTCPVPASAEGKPENGPEDAVLRAIDGLRDPRIPNVPLSRNPGVVPVEAEWTGYRAAATKEERMPAELDERGRYDEMMKEVKARTTVLYFHGGAYYLMDPATHRPTVKKLAKLTGGRCYSVRYRLAPQNPFPAALVDALTSYLALLYPPEGAFHEAVRPEDVVFAGDSAGGNLSLALLQTLLELRRQNATVRWLGVDRAVPLPAGVAVNSPWMDITHSSPSCESNAGFDYLPSPVHQTRADALRPPCDAWPANPPRSNLYADDAFVAHPLVTLTLAQDWRGAPPVYICTGWELLSDEDRHAAHRFWRQGVRTVFEEYEAMPHCFALLFTNLPGARRCMEGWAGFIKEVTTTTQVGEKGEEIGKSKFTTIKAGTLEEVQIDPTAEGALTEHTDEEIAARIHQLISMKMVPVTEGNAKL